MIKEFFERNPNPVEPGYVFVLLPEKSRGIYQTHVKKAVDDLELKCESFLDLTHAGNALEDVLSRIQKAEILIYDITDLTANVMWELGVGLTIKEESRVIVIREETDTVIPFNIYSHRISHQYDPSSEESLLALHKTVKEAMKKIIKGRVNTKGLPISAEVKALLETALTAVTNREWIAAEALFQTMDNREPENWFIHNQWGIMHRTKGEIESAILKFQQALEYTEANDDRSFIFTELAVLHQMSRKYSDAEEWFRKAEKADSENSRLYIAWAECYDELGDHFSAQAKIGGALARMGKGREGDPNYQELRLRHNYYGRKIEFPTYRKTFAQFKQQEGLPKGLREDENENGDRLPYNLAWQELEKDYVGKVVVGQVSNITAEHGIFVKLCRDFTGLVFWRNLCEGYGEKYSRGQTLKVKISKAFIHPKDRQGRIDLRLTE